jgi:hypothetical protein
MYSCLYGAPSTPRQCVRGHHTYKHVTVALHIEPSVTAVIVQYKYLSPRPEQDAGACARRERNRLGLWCAEKLVQTCARSQTSACSCAATCTSLDTSSGTSIWSSRSPRPNLASPRAAAPTVPPAQLWAASVPRPRELWRRCVMLPHALRRCQSCMGHLRKRKLGSPRALQPPHHRQQSLPPHLRRRSIQRSSELAWQSRLLTAARGHARAAVRYARILTSILIG